MITIFPTGGQKLSGNLQSLAERTLHAEGRLWTRRRAPILHTSLYLTGTEALQLHQIPKAAGAAELTGAGACEGTPLCLYSLLRSKRSWRHTTDTGACQEAGGHFLLGEQLAAPLGHRNSSPRGFRAELGRAPLFRRAGKDTKGRGETTLARARPPLPPSFLPRRTTLTPGESRGRLPGRGPLCHTGVAGREAAPGGRPGPYHHRRRGPHSPAGSQASSSAHRQHPRGAMALPPPPARGRRAGPPRRAHRALPFPWHLSQGRALPLAAVSSLRGPSPPARRQVRLPSSLLRKAERQNTIRQLQKRLKNIYIYT